MGSTLPLSISSSISDEDRQEVAKSLHILASKVAKGEADIYVSEISSASSVEITKFSDTIGEFIVVSENHTGERTTLEIVERETS